jgi:hypothetical protein
LVPPGGFIPVLKAVYRVGLCSSCAAGDPKLADQIIDPAGASGDSLTGLPAGLRLDFTNVYGELDEETYRFRITYTANKGYSFFMNDTDGSVPPSTVTWALGTPVTGTDTLLIGGVRPTDRHNAILIEVKAVEPAGDDATASRLSFNFTGGLGVTCGSLVPDMFIDDPPGGIKRQWIVADGDLSQTSWVLSGRINLDTDTSSQANDNAANTQLRVWTYDIGPHAADFKTCPSGEQNVVCTVSVYLQPAAPRTTGLHLH